jgi:hypothetical protein
MMSYDDAIAELEEQIKQQAAVIEQMRPVLKNVQWNINPERGFADELELDISNALALRSSPKVLNKVRADAVREAAKWVGFTTNCNCNLHMMDFAQRIEKGEA